MLRSMTGYGSGEHSAQGRRVRVELKSVNQRFLDIHVRAPRQVLQVEDRLRKLIEGAVSRGRITVYVDWQNLDSGDAQLIDTVAARALVSQLRELKDELDLTGDVDVSVLAGAREYLAKQDAELTADDVWAMVEPPIRTAIAELVAMREQEGRDLARAFAERFDEAERLMVIIREEAPRASGLAKSRLEDRIGRLTAGSAVVDENRLAQEVALAAERADFTEESVRLDSHLARMRECLDSDEPVGKRMNFLSQEMHREVNTIGSKNEDARVSEAVVSLKEEIEKIREQVQNIE